MSLAPTHGQRNWWQRPKSRDRPLDDPHSSAYYDGQERDINRSDTFNMSKHPSNSRLRDLASALRLTKKPDRPVSSEPSPLTPRFRSNTVVGAKSKSTFSPVSTNSSYSTADRDSLDIPITPTSNSFWRSSGGGRDPFASQPMVITPTSTTSSQAREIPSLKPNRSVPRLHF
ncbi:hypothetical protein SISNIDRAFT_327863 [Sistotremastrum niveocremeum HHB9708]|uniref:Uncharacterized protein n=1 Tax=Sistotremastrum niveocremeum HHB9708 TaxID=1314777 RepID=A0A164XCJ6_9AGAM|nr:hypothetical protein SISNIDRAFT_327863 [Sistotremastrum niveocremeum HHB9708]